MGALSGMTALSEIEAIEREWNERNAREKERAEIARRVADAEHKRAVMDYDDDYAERSALMIARRTIRCR